MQMSGASGHKADVHAYTSLLACLWDSRAPHQAVEAAYNVHCTLHITIRQQ